MIQSVCRIFASITLIVSIFYSGSALTQSSGMGELEISLLLKDFDYRELSTSNQLLNKESGLIVGLGLSYNEQYGTSVLQLDAAIYDNAIDYEGRSQSGSPITTTSDATIGELNFLLTHWIAQKAKLHYGIYAGIGLYYWERNIRSTTTVTNVPVNGLLETYLVGYGSLGTKVKFLLNEQSSWSVDMRVNKVLYANVDVDFQGFGGYDKATLDMEKKYGFRIGFPWEKKLSRNSFLTINPYYEFWKFGVSNIKTLTINGVPSAINIQEPQSETTNYGLNLGFRQFF